MRDEFDVLCVCMSMSEDKMERVWGSDTSFFIFIFFSRVYVWVSEKIS